VPDYPGCPGKEAIKWVSLSILHRVSEKTANFFLSEFRQISTNFDNFWQKDGKEAKIM